MAITCGPSHLIARVHGPQTTYGAKLMGLCVAVPPPPPPGPSQERSVQTEVQNQRLGLWPPHTNYTTPAMSGIYGTMTQQQQLNTQTHSRTHHRTTTATESRRSA